MSITPEMRGFAADILNPDTGPSTQRYLGEELAAQILSAPATVITVSVRCVFGIDRVYPADNTAALFAALLNVKSFNATQISAIRALGYAVHVAAGQLPREFQPA